ncbi:hypothetical protein [Sneathiella glossodoripedis]|uniref:hypothetical protein n=1 Tax=Sneathiella glossodoripedis TaxID=418853 RepID=UPI000470DC5C|nr:hypothetical protein [Sneathiella glossodoripedis]
MQKMVQSETPAIREAVGLFQDMNALYDCVDTLQNRGFDRSEISLMNFEAQAHSINGKTITNMRKLEDDPSVKRMPFIERQSLGDAQGFLIALPIYIFTLLGVGISTALSLGTVSMFIVAAGCGFLGCALGLRGAYWIKGRSEKSLKDQLARGGIPIWIRVKDKQHEERALEVLKEFNALDVHIHDLKEEPYMVDDGRTTVVHILH